MASLENDINLQISVSQGRQQEANEKRGGTRENIARDRRLSANANKYKSRGATDVKKISLRDRVSQFANEQLCVKGIVIFCNACKEVVSPKRASWLVIVPPKDK